MNILIVGKTSFVGQGVDRWFRQKQPRPQVSCMSVRDDGWKGADLTGFDVVIFTAALVHRPEVTDWNEYERLNARLPYEFAIHAKAQGVKQFLFISTVSVHQAERTLPKGFVITPQTPLAPPSLYGKSKLMGERLVQSLADEQFHVSVIRPTFVYGQNCRGQHIQTLHRVATRLPVLPKAFANEPLGMVYIDNLAELCWLVANSGCSGVYHAQDRHPLSTYGVWKAMAPRKIGIPCTWLFRPFVKISAVNRLFGGSAYTEEMAKCPLGNYQLVSPEDGICRSIK